MLIRELFSANVTRAIPPVVYFHEQSPDKVATEVSEYIITGGYPETDPRRRRVPDGIHEQFLRLLTALHQEIKRGPELPASWISGFYGSGKSSFAKLLGLALDGCTLPDGTPLAAALLARDDSPKRQEFVDAWHALYDAVVPIAAVFDIGAVARDGEHVHGACLREIHKRLGYCPTSPLVAETELKLEIDGRWEHFEKAAEEALGRPWCVAKTEAMAEDYFSAAIHRLDPEIYTEPMSWIDSHIGAQWGRGISADEAARAIGTMLRHRAPGRTLFLVVDEVSQYVHQDEDRMLKLQSFVSALGQRLKGGVWLLATGQQKLDDASGEPLQKLKDRFPPNLRVHLNTTNIRDVVHRRLLHKDPTREPALRELFQKHRADLKLNAYDCHAVTEEDFVEVYPLLPGHVDLLMRITTALRTHSTRIQGDHHAIRGLLQLLGELFRTRKLADRPLGALVALDAIYEVQHSSLDADLQATLAQVLNHEAAVSDPLAGRVVRAVALLEQIQETIPTTQELVAQCLYDELGQGSRLREVQAVLRRLHEANCLSYTEQYGYKIQSSAGQEWTRERDDLLVPDEQVHALVEEKLDHLMGIPERPRWKGRPFPWALQYSDRFKSDVRLGKGRDETTVIVDFRFLTDRKERRDDEWARRSSEGEARNRLVWVVGEPGDLRQEARELLRSRRMIERYQARRAGLSKEKMRLLIEEEGRMEHLDRQVVERVAVSFMGGTLFFRGQLLQPVALANGFADAIRSAAERFLPDLYQHYTEIAVTEREWPQLLERDLAGASTKFFESGLGILGLDAGKTVPTCAGLVPQRVLKFIEDNNGAGGNTLISHFARPPYGYPLDVLRACLIGLLRAGRISIQPEGGASPITSYADPGTKDLFGTDRSLRLADYLPAKAAEVTQRDLVAIRRFFESSLGLDLEPEPEGVADAAFQQFPNRRAELRSLEGLFERLPGRPELPPALAKLGKALEACLADRHVMAITKAVKRHLDDLREGLQQLGIVRSELTEEAVQEIAALAAVRETRVAQLVEIGRLDGDAREAAQTIEAQLALERPWRGIVDARAAGTAVREAYGAVRSSLLAGQEAEFDRARAAVKARSGFERLTPEHSHHVLRPLREALIVTDEDAMAPTLASLQSQFPDCLRRALEEANTRLDEILEELTQKPVKQVRLRIHGRELETREELRTLLREIEDELGPLVDREVRVRII